jgi:hypothetical protein
MNTPLVVLLVSSLELHPSICIASAKASRVYHPQFLTVNETKISVNWIGGRRQNINGKSNNALNVAKVKKEESIVRPHHSRE